jgi:hypothetical protein
MEWNLNVPKILHVYWGGGIMPYIRYTTVKSFMKYNPDWKIMFWYPKYPFTVIKWKTGELNYEVYCDDFLPKLMSLPIQKTAVDFNVIGFRNDVTENFKSDYLRAYTLSTIGGVWSDMDIIYFKPINNLIVNDPKNKNIETFVCISGYGHSNGFLMSIQGNKFYEKILSLSICNFNQSLYQAIGPTLYNRYYRDIKLINELAPTVNMEMNTVYSHNAGQIFEFLSNSSPRFTEGSIGSHWYAGHPQWGNFINMTNGGLRNLPNNIIGNLLKETMTYE